MDNIPSPIEVQSWPQAIVMIVLIVCVMVVPSVFAYLSNRTAKAAKVEAEETKEAALKVERTLTTNNGGSHVKDQLDRMEKMIKTQGNILGSHMDWSSDWAAKVEDRLDEAEKKRRRLPFLG